MFLKFTFFLLILSFPLGQLSKIPINILGLEEIKIYLNDILIFLFLLVWLLWHVIKRKKFFFHPYFKHLKPFLVFLCLSFILNIFNFKTVELFVGFLYLLRFLVYTSLLSIIYDLIKINLLEKKFLKIALAFTGLIFSFLGIFQYIFYPDIRVLSPLGWDLHYYRLVGTFFDPNFSGLFLALLILFLLENFSAYLCLLPFTSLLLTYSRSSYLAFSTGISSLLFFKRKPKLIPVILLIFVSFLSILPRAGGEGVKLGRVTSAFQRIESWKTAFEIWKKYPLFGIGFNNLRYAKNKFGFFEMEVDWKTSHSGAGIENSFLFVLATSGIFGLISFINFLTNIFLKTKAKIIKASTVSLIIHSLFLNSFFYPWIMIWFFIILAVEFTEYKKQ